MGNIRNHSIRTVQVTLDQRTFSFIMSVSKEAQSTLRKMHGLTTYRSSSSSSSSSRLRLLVPCCTTCAG